MSSPGLSSRFTRPVTMSHSGTFTETVSATKEPVAIPKSTSLTLSRRQLIVLQTMLRFLLSKLSFMSCVSSVKASPRVSMTSIILIASPPLLLPMGTVLSSFRFSSRLSSLLLLSISC